MRVEYENYRRVYVQIPEEAYKNYYHSGGYVEYTGVAWAEVTENGSLAICTCTDATSTDWSGDDGDIHVFAAGQWIHCNSEAMDKKK